ncbi:CPBP family glutamic-type intramembrane protease [Pseudactinotalea suaedae]|uniref:CPBP family glutamic-type intramembrane protease n=1 Tax=Pseudactinotalea suaedae TaxID=1524924 RepID=UPI0019D6095F|nr:CPBP family glutamic-type intramembrane protease [Pseudactinotalea suaedae]
MVLATIVLGAVVLALSLRIEPGDAAFYPATFALAGVWVVGALASGPLRLGRIQFRGRARRPLLTPLLVGLGLAAIFAIGALLVRELPVLGEQVRDVLGFAVEGPLALLLAITVVNGVAEELFFRGAVYEVAPRYPIVVATVANVAVVVASGNLMLGLAAAILAVVVGWLRRVTGGVLAPMITHVTWSTAMLLVLPWLFG